MVTITSKGFIGINQHRDASLLRNGEFADALNLSFQKGTADCRPGYTADEAVGSGPILGLFDFKRADGTVLQLAKSGSELYKNSAGTWSLVGSGLSSTGMASFAVMGDRCYMVDGTNLKVTDGASIYDAQIARPTSAPTLAASAGAGPLVGTYDYKITYYSSTWGQESPASDASSTVALEDKGVDLSAIPTSGDARVDKVRIYRRKVSASETLWFLVTEINNGTATYADTTLDVDTSSTEFAPLSYDESLPGFKNLVVHQDVMFLTGDNDLLWYTLVGKPWSVANNFRVGGEGSHEKITGLASYNGVLVVFKEDTIWHVSGLTENTFSSTPVVNGTGCRAQHSIVPSGNLLYFLSDDGFYAYNGGEAVKISKPIETIAKAGARNLARDMYCVGVEYEDIEAIVWSWSALGSSTNNKAAAFFVSNTVEMGAQSWCPWTFAGSVSAMCRVTADQSTRAEEIWYGLSTGMMVSATGTTDAGTDIPILLKTPKLDGGVPTWQKHWPTMTCEFVDPDYNSDIEVRAYRDNESEYDLVDYVNPDEPSVHLRLSTYARDLALEWYSEDGSSFELVSWGVDVLRAGRSHA